METKSITVCDAYRINVSCERNDWADIKCDVPAMLGYDFVVSPYWDIKETMEEIKNIIIKYKRPFIGISYNKYKNFNVKYLWTMEKIEECIKNNSVC